MIKANNLLEKYPNVAKEWDVIKNFPLLPEEVAYASHKNVFWKCKNGHEWKANINNRSTGGHRCPYCVGKKISKGNSLVAKRAYIAKEWDYSKNIGINIEEVFEFSNLKVWWICGKGHSFQQLIEKRCNRGTGCPYCAGRLPTNENCLLTKNPDLCEEWDYDKNKLTPDGITAHSAKFIFWKCKKGHRWKARLDSRVRGHTNCPYCHGIFLKDGTLCDSKAEAIKYIEYKEKGMLFEHHKKYCLEIGNFECDFYFPLENKYVEITSYKNNNLSHLPGRYFRYIRKIVTKRKIVTNILKANFEFVQFSPTRSQMNNLRKYIA